MKLKIQFFIFPREQSKSIGGARAIFFDNRRGISQRRKHNNNALFVWAHSICCRLPGLIWEALWRVIWMDAAAAAGSVCVFTMVSFYFVQFRRDRKREMVAFASSI